MWRTGADYNRPKWGVYRGKDDALRDEQVLFNDWCISESSASLCPSSVGSNPGSTTLTAKQDATTSELNSFPNPFRESNTILFSLNKPAHTNLAVYDITGKQVAVLINSTLQAGDHKAVFNANHFPAGVYTLKLQYNGKIITKKLLKQ